MRPFGNVRCNYYQRALPQHCFRREFTFTANHGFKHRKTQPRGLKLAAESKYFYLPAFCSVSFVNFWNIALEYKVTFRRTNALHSGQYAFLWSQLSWPAFPKVIDERGGGEGDLGCFHWLVFKGNLHCCRKFLLKLLEIKSMVQLFF